MYGNKYQRQTFFYITHKHTHMSVKNANAKQRKLHNVWCYLCNNASLTGYFSCNRFACFNIGVTSPNTIHHSQRYPTFSCVFCWRLLCIFHKPFNGFYTGSSFFARHFEIDLYLDINALFFN